MWSVSAAHVLHAPNARCVVSVVSAPNVATAASVPCVVKGVSVAIVVPVLRQSRRIHPKRP